jgi:hypothetical protein
MKFRFASTGNPRARNPPQVTDQPGVALPNLPDPCDISSRFSLSNFPDQVRFEGHRRFNGPVDVNKKLGRET